MLASKSLPDSCHVRRSSRTRRKHLSIGLKRALELAHVCLWVFPLAIQRVGEPYRAVESDLLPVGRLARRSTGDRSWFFHSQAPTLELGHRRHAASVLPSRDVAAFPLAVRTAGSFRPPSPRVSNGPTPLLPERRYPTDGGTSFQRSIGIVVWTSGGPRISREYCIGGPRSPQDWPEVSWLSWPGKRVCRNPA